MPKLTVFLLVLKLSLLGSDICYKIDKKYIKSNLKQPVGLIINIHDMFTNPQVNEYNATTGYVDIEFNTPKDIQYLSSAYLMCGTDDKNLFNCSKDGEGEILVKKIGNEVYFKLYGARMSQTPDDPIVYSFHGVSEDFIEGKKVSCFRSLDAVVEVKNFAKDKNRQIIIDSLKKLKDIVIYDIDYNDKVAIAVGEDNSVKTRKKQLEDEYHKPIVLFSYDSGKSWKYSYGKDDNIPFTRVKLIKNQEAIAVGSMEGSGGKIALTKDGGKSWKTVYEDGFINDIVQVKNSYIVVGFAVLKSEDGLKWKRVDKPNKKENDFYHVINIKDRLIASSYDEILYSDDFGRTWKNSFESSGAMYYLYKNNNKIYAWSKYNGELVSSDGKNWKFLSAKE